MVLKSQDGKEYAAHRIIVSASSNALKALLSGGFKEGEQIDSGEPLSIAASSGTVAALLDYLYGGEPVVDMVDAVELLRLGDAYALTDLVAVVEAAILESLDSATALQILLHTSPVGTSKLHAACESHVADDFLACAQQASFVDLPAWQLARLLKREDLRVKREEAVLEALFTWLNSSKDRGSCMGPMLPMVDFASFSQKNLEQVRLFAQSLGENGFALQMEVDAVINDRKRVRCDSSSIRPKRRCLSHWSAEMGAYEGKEEIYLQGSLEWPCGFCAHGDLIYIADADQVLRWKAANGELQVVAGRGAQVNGVNDLGKLLENVAVSPDGELLVVDVEKRERVISFKDGVGKETQWEGYPFFSPNGVLYLFGGALVQRVDSTTLCTVIDIENLPEDQRFADEDSIGFVASYDEVIYIVGGSRILRFSPGDSEGTIVWHNPGSSFSCIHLFGDTMYVADARLRTIWSFCADEPVVQVALDLSSMPNACPIEALVCDGWLYVLHEAEEGFVSRHRLPPPIKLPSRS